MGKVTEPEASEFHQIHRSIKKRRRPPGARGRGPKEENLTKAYKGWGATKTAKSCADWTNLNVRGSRDRREGLKVIYREWVREGKQ